MPMHHTIICGLPRSTKIFSHYLIKGTILEKNIIGPKMCVLSFSAVFIWNIAYSKKKCATYDRKITLIFMWSTRFSYPMDLEFFSTDFQKYSKIKFHKNPSSGSRVVPCGRTDRHDESNNLFWTFFSEPKNSTFCPQIALKSLSQNEYRLFPQTVLNGLFDNQEGKCLLRGTSWMFKSSSRFCKSIKPKFNETLLQIAEMNASIT